ncbi:hydroxysteroid dehydrogenase-like protein 1 [Calliphora vicina]|uniref:hydroxysteroid dehydrogenase-like protein 1 n=1 Tax=Calliphora vicina TaxID=7373 RepID=UPI00325C2619
MFEGYLIGVGIYALACYLYDNLRTPMYLLYRSWQQRHKPQQIHLMEKYGKWAAVTGSTDGIGKAYARELARLGFNIVLISRTQTKLEAVAQEIETDFAVETFIVQCDFSKGAEIYNNLFNKLSEKPIGILINNVGIGHNPPGPIGTFSPEHMWQVINVNIGAATQLSRHFIYKWRKAGEKGLIVNISSGIELQSCPFGSIYGGSKAYMQSFTKALQEETKNMGITIQLCSPNFVVTKINSYSMKVMRGNLLIPPPEEYAKWAVSTLGKVDETSGYFWHGIQNAIWKILPYRLRAALFVIICKKLVDKLGKMETREETNKS